LIYSRFINFADCLSFLYDHTDRRERQSAQTENVRLMTDSAFFHELKTEFDVMYR